MWKNQVTEIYIHTSLEKSAGNSLGEFLTIKTESMAGSSKHIRAAHSLKGNLLRLAAELPERRVCVFSFTLPLRPLRPSGTDARLVHLV